MAQSSDYLLGINQTELERLRFQHGVWGMVTNKFFDRLQIQQGWKCLDVGAGPGFVSIDLRERVGANGEITALEPSEFYLDWFKHESEKRHWSNVKFIRGTAEDAALPERYYDFIFARWVIGFVPDPEKFLVRLFSALKLGGIIALQDYNYEGLSLFPRGGAFDGMADVVRAYWRSGGGDPYVAAGIPAIFRKHNIQLVDYTPTCLAGGPDSDVIEWAHRFFITHIQIMVDKGIMNQKQGDAMLADWLAHRKNPDAVFFSPIVVDMAGKRKD
jgi:SAM-dependent methyltransferase